MERVESATQHTWGVQLLGLWHILVLDEGKFPPDGDRKAERHPVLRKSFIDIRGGSELLETSNRQLE